jgi:hypothetical protein
MGGSGDDVASLQSNHETDRAERPLSRGRSGETKRRDMSVLQVGTIEPWLASALQAKYQALQLPNGPTRTAFLAEHGASVTAVVHFGAPVWTRI